MIYLWFISDGEMMSKVLTYARIEIDGSEV